MGTNALVESLLAKTSRTFALAIPLLDPPLAHDVGLAYLLLRAADTLEDETTWPAATRARALRRFAEHVEALDPKSARILVEQIAELEPIRDPSCRELVTRLPDLAASLNHEASHKSLLGHVKRTALGMAELIERAEKRGRTGLDDLHELRGYCYVVAGIVGELLTDLFLLAEPGLEPVATELRANAALFGEGLQLVNVLKDRRDDLADGRSFVPSTVEPSALFALARQDLVHASHYVEALVRSGASHGTVAFSALPLRLACETLDRIEADGPGAKLSRARVAEIYAELTAKMDR